MLESGSTPWGGNRNLYQNKKNNLKEKGARLGLIEDWSSFLFLDRKTDDLRHKDKKDIFSVGVFLDKKTDDLRHKDKKDIFSVWVFLDKKTDSLRHKDIKDIFCFLCFYFWSLLLSCFYLCVFTFGLFVFSSFIMACREVYALFFLTLWHGPFISNKICFFCLSVFKNTCCKSVFFVFLSSKILVANLFFLSFCLQKYLL